MTETNIVIVKVQVPLYSNDPHITKTTGLVYEEDRRVLCNMELNPFVLNALNGDFKGYFEAIRHPGTNEYTIGRRVGDQPW